MMDLSIIIPVYGVEKYVEDCIRSCIENIGDSTQNVEVIVVDDGSKDRSMEIVCSLTEGLPYFRILTQKNQGLSVARNTGLYSAKGDFVWFIDSDDYIRNGAIQLVLKAIQNDVDIIDVSYEDVGEFSNRLEVYKQHATFSDGFKVFSGRQRFVKGFNVGVPFHIFRRQFLIENKLEMYPGIFHEDCEFTPRAMWVAAKVKVQDDIVYFYRRRQNSIMTVSNPKKATDLIFVANRLNEYFCSSPLSVSEKVKVDNLISMFFCNGLHCAKGLKKEDSMIVSNEIIKNKEVLSCLKNATIKKYKLLGSLGLLFPNHVLSIYMLMEKIKKRSL